MINTESIRSHIVENSHLIISMILMYLIGKANRFIHDLLLQFILYKRKGEREKWKAYHIMVGNDVNNNWISNFFFFG